MKYRSFSIPKDIYIFFAVIPGILRFRHKVNKEGYNNILKGIEGVNQGAAPGMDFLAKYKKFYRASSFFLVRLFKDPNPCMIRSLILYELCRKNNIGAVLKTGVKKNGKALDGHSWIEIGEKPVMENSDYLKGFTVIHET